MKKIFLVATIAILLIAGGFLLVNRYSKPATSSFAASISPIEKENNQNNQKDSNSDQNFSAPLVLNTMKFLGEEGTSVNFENGEVRLKASIFSDNRARFYSIEMPSGKIIHFFVVKDRNGIYRAAADACQVCFTERKGFHQEGNEIVCNNCGNRYPIEKIATEKGGCNPGPINPNLEIREGQIIIEQVDIEQVADLF